MSENDFAMLAALKISGEATPEELLQLEKLLEEQPLLMLQLLTLEKIWQEKHSLYPANTKTAYNRHLQRLSNHLSQPVLQYEEEKKFAGNELQEPVERNIRNYRRLWISLAAAASVISFFLLYLQYGKTSKNNTSLAQNTVSTRPGTRSQLTMPDGTQVWLNAGSKLTYSEHSYLENREVSLTGEAYFDVIKDKAHPFVIHTQTADVKVLGTAFNIRSYPNEEITETALIRGIVEVTPHNNPDKKIILKPYEKLTLRNNDTALKETLADGTHKDQNETLMVLQKLHTNEKDSTTAETSWTRNTLAFDAETMEQVALKLERWYAVKVVITDKTLRGVKYTGTYTNETLQEVLNSLKLSGKFNYGINGKEVTIRP